MNPKSILFSPGDRPYMLRKGLQSDSDVVVFDLEDSVSYDRKDQARKTVYQILSETTNSPPKVAVRVNSGPGTKVDLRSLDGAPLDAVMLPKVNGPQDIEVVQSLLDESSLECPIIALIETAEGVLNAPSIASQSATSALAFGAEDFIVDIGAVLSTDVAKLHYPRARLVLAAKAAGVSVIDSVVTDYKDIGKLKRESELAVELGFDGKLAIHPAQVDIINEIFTPGQDLIDWATEVLAAADDLGADGAGAFGLDGDMIDKPKLVQAKQILNRAEIDFE
jgi:citrate lyase subunit beta/citryl-CoA lyase